MRKNIGLKAAVKELFDIIDQVEVSDSGKEFHPTEITCCRAHLLPKLNDLIKVIKKHINA